MDPAGVLLGAGSHEPALHGHERAGLIGANRVLGSRARIAVQAAGQIDRQSFRGRGVELIDDRVQRRTRLAAGAGAQQRVDDPIHPGELLRQSGRVVAIAKHFDRHARLPQDIEIRSGVARQFGRIGPHEHADLDARGGRGAGR